jgi:hypothetical protein
MAGIYIEDSFIFLSDYSRRECVGGASLDIEDGILLSGLFIKR